jgi:hypothetical protein
MASLAEIREILARGETVTLPKKYLAVFMEECINQPCGTESYKITPSGKNVLISDEQAIMRKQAGLSKQDRQH